MTAPKQRIGSLLGLSAMLGAVLAFELMVGPFFVPEPPSVSLGSKTAVVSPSAPPPAQPDISAFSEIVARPLFAQTRRPVPPKAEVKVAENAPKPETFDLIGVVISKDGRMALLRTLSTSEVTRAVEGQNVGGWKVSDIKPTQVVLRHGDDSEVIKINDAAAPPAGNTPGAGNPSIPGTPSPQNIPSAPGNPSAASDLSGATNPSAALAGDAAASAKVPGGPNSPPPVDASAAKPQPVPETLGVE